MKHIITVNAHLKYVEFLLHVFDKGPNDLKLGEIRKEFMENFKIKTLYPLLNQDFGVYRLLPLILIKEEYKNQKAELAGDIATIKVIRDAISHNTFSVDEIGYKFENNKQKVTLSYSEFLEFLHRVENEFYSQSKVNNLTHFCPKMS